MANAENNCIDDTIKRVSDLKKALSRLWYYQGNLDNKDSICVMSPYRLAICALDDLNVQLQVFNYRNKSSVNISEYEMVLVLAHVLNVKLSFSDIDRVVVQVGNCMSRRIMVKLNLLFECLVIDMERVKKYYSYEYLIGI
jgi:hypothetical protein